MGFRVKVVCTELFIYIYRERESLSLYKASQGVCSFLWFINEGKYRAHPVYEESVGGDRGPKPKARTQPETAKLMTQR